jgi:hypothetical protein
VVVEAPTSSEATASASALLVEALCNAGVDGAYECDSHVLPMSEVERGMKEAREDIETLAPNTNRLTFRVVRSDDEDRPPDAPHRA